MKSLLARLRPDLYLSLIVLMMVLATIVPARGQAAEALQWGTRFAVGLVFFLHGARLAAAEVRRGLTHWRLQLLVLAITFGAFPLLGLGLAALPAWITPAALAPGLVVLCCLPSTVQSSIAFTAIARGDVAAAVTAATVSNVLGVFLSPLLIALTLGASSGGVSLASLQGVAVQLLAPFLAGQALRPWIGRVVARHAKALGWSDRGSILLVVYGAFSAAVASGLWSRIGALDLLRLALICALLLAVVLGLSTALARLLRFGKAQEIAVVFCGSKKSLASGVPMASVIFPPALVGPLVLPLMIFHQIQLMVCAAIAQQHAKRRDMEAASG